MGRREGLMEKMKRGAIRKPGWLARRLVSKFNRHSAIGAREKAVLARKLPMR